MAPRPSRERDALRGRVRLLCVPRTGVVQQQDSRHMASCSTSPGLGPTRDGYRDQRMPVRLRPLVQSGCSSIAERVVGDDEAAGAIPATQTNGRRLTSRTASSASSPPRPCVGPTTMLTVTSPMQVRILPSVHDATVPRIGTQVREACWQRFNSSQWHHMRRGLGNRAGLQIRLTVRSDS